MCMDINECIYGSDGCDENARCINTWGSYVCAPHSTPRRTGTRSRSTRRSTPRRTGTRSRSTRRSRSSHS
jgi:hypothetical protein